MRARIGTPVPGPGPVLLQRLLRLVVAAVLVLTGAMALGLRAPSASAAEPAADDYVACLNGSKRGDVLVLIDTSASLQSSDPEAARIAAGEYLLRRLARSADDGRLQLNVALAGFANRYEAGSTWQPLDEGSIDGVLGDIRAFENRNDGQGTDYWLGLDGARRALAERKQAEPDSCQAVVFFSDGALDIDRAPDEDANPIARPYDPDNPLQSPADRDRAKQSATESMCRSGGLADQTRVVPITIFGVGLTAGGTQAPDFDLMRRIVEGGCGSEPAAGQFALADDIDQLLRAFDRIAGEGTEQEAAYCQGDQAQLCEEGAHDFVLDASITSVSVLGSGDVAEPRIVLVTPLDRQVELRQSPLGAPQDLTIDGATLSYTWMSPRTFSATLDSTDRIDGWTGRWRLIFLDPLRTDPQARSRTSIHVSGNIFPAWPGARTTQIRAGEVTDVAFGLEDAAQEPVDPAQLLGTAAMDATLIDADGNETPIARGLGRDQLTRPQRLDTTALRPGPASMRLALQVTTAGWRDPRTGENVPGTPLKPQLADIPFTVLPPAGFGRVDQSVDFGTADGPVDLSGTLAAYGPGCVWVDSDTAPRIRTGPTEVTDVAIGSPATSAETCVRVENGATDAVPLTLTSPQTGSGALTGSFVVKMASLDAPDRVQDLAVDYTAEVQRPLNTTNFLLALIAALLLGPGIPLALLYLAKWATAKIPDRPLLTQMVPVSFEGSTVTRDGGGFALRDGDLTTMARIPPGGARSLDVGGIVLATRTGKSPLGSGEVRVESGPRLGASSAHPEPVGDRHQARLPLAVHNTWVLLHDPGGPPDAGTALLLVAGDAGPQQRQALVDDFARRAPHVFAGLRAVAAAEPQPASGPPGSMPERSPATTATGGPNPFAGAEEQTWQPPGQPSSQPPRNPFGQNPFT